MRIVIALLAVSGVAHADVVVGGAVGAGGQGAATYSAIEARLDGEWRGMRFGLGARGVWLDGELRTSEWEGWRALRVLRLFEAHGEQLAIAAGGLAPAKLQHVADGYRATLDDRPRTGVRGALSTTVLSLGLEIDDVVEPHLIGGAAEVAIGERWIGCAALAVDPRSAESDTIGAFEGCAARRWSRVGGRVDAGGGLIGERMADGNGMAAIGFVRGALDARGARWTGEAELRAGSSGALFGPLHRIEEHDEQRGVGASASIGVTSTRGWLRGGIRVRPGGGTLAELSAGAPASKYFQVAGWIVASEKAAVGVAELRITWAKCLASAIEFGRIYNVQSDPMQPAAVSTATAWFAIQQTRRKQ